MPPQPAPGKKAKNEPMRKVVFVLDDWYDQNVRPQGQGKGRDDDHGHGNGQGKGKGKHGRDD